MSLGELYQQDVDRSLSTMAAIPPDPPKRDERTAWGAPWRAIKAAAADVLGSTADVLKGYGAASAMTLEADPVARAVLGDKAVQQGAAEGRRQIATGEALVSDVGQSFRQVSKDQRPDPVTASKAEQIVFGVVRPVSKLVAGGVMAGPFGIVGAAGEEGFTHSEDLREQGVDFATRTKIGTLTAGVNAAGAFLPMAGPTLKATAGLYLLGGPGAFMAQQQATRKILEHADYAELAKQYDPLDPTGLALSLGLLPFAAHGAVRNVRAARGSNATARPEAAPAGTPDAIPTAPPVPPEVVDAAMVHNLTLQQDVHEAGVVRPETAQIVRPSDSGQPEPQRAGARASGPEGATATVVTERGLTAPVRYRLVEASDLITSHTNDLTPTAAFPAELQPRDRSRSASADQIARIENAVRPELLGESVKASDGAPIIGPDAVVESGNARTIALRRAYESGKADGYRQWLAANAQRFGLTADQVAGMLRPVLVRERYGNLDRAEFARQANESAIAAMSPTEQARADAARVTDLTGLVANEDGSINLAKSAGFVRQFMQQAVSPTERGAMLQADGRLSQAGQQRLRNAIFAKAYGDANLVSMLAESTDSNVRNVLAGLMRAAPEVARLRDLVAAGARHPMDVAGDMVRAVQEFSKIRADGMTVDQFMAQGNLLDAGLPPQLQTLLAGLQENARSPRRIGEMVRQLVDSVDALGDPRQAGLLEDRAPTQADVTAAAVERMRTLSDEQITDTPAPLNKPSTDPLLASIADRVSAVEATAGDMVVRTDEAGRPVTVADELARIRREAAEGTDAELGALDADLVRVAAECALSMGST